MGGKWTTVKDTVVKILLNCWSNLDVNVCLETNTLNFNDDNADLLIIDIS